MSLGTYDACCRVINLRTGTFIIAGLCLVFETISMIVHSVIAWTVTNDADPRDGFIYLLKFMIFLFMLMIVFKLVLTAALLVGLIKRLPDHLEMWYKGYLLLVMLQTAITITVAVKVFKKANVLFWLVIAERTIVSLITIYFILIVRSYYFKMCRESNYYQNIIYTENSKGQLKIEKDKCHTYEEVMFKKNAETTEEAEAPTYGFTKKGGGVVYSSPRPQPNAVMDMPMPNLENSGKNQTSMLYPALVQ